MNFSKFHFKNGPLYWSILTMPFIIGGCSFVSVIIFLSVGFYVRILFVLLLIKIFHTILAKGMKSVKFLESTVEVQHYNLKTTSIPLVNIEAIEARKFTFYQIHYTNVVRLKKNSQIKLNIRFYCPDELLEEFKTYLSERNIRYIVVCFEL